MNVSIIYNLFVDDDPSHIVNDIIGSIKPSDFSTLYLNPYELSNHAPANCAIMTAYLGLLSFYYPDNTFGVQSYRDNWIDLMGDRGACTILAPIKLNYINATSTSTPDFSDWQYAQFGGWDRPYSKVYSYRMCNTDGSVIYIG